MKQIIRRMWHLALDNAGDILRIGMTFPLRYLAHALGHATFRAKVRHFGTIVIRPRSSDADVVRQIFRTREYDISHFRQYPRIRRIYDEICEAGGVPIVIDAGANIGASAIWFAREFPRSRIVAIEPDPENARLCRLNVRDFDNIDMVEAAIGSKSGFVSLFNPEGTPWAVQTVREEHEVGIRIYTVPELTQRVQNGRLFLVKIDVEGFEYDLFGENTEWVGEAQVIFVEPHDWLFPGKRTSAPFRHALSTADFELLINGENLVYVRA